MKEEMGQYRIRRPVTPKRSKWPDPPKAKAETPSPPGPQTPQQGQQRIPSPPRSQSSQQEREEEFQRVFREERNPHMRKLMLNHQCKGDVTVEEMRAVERQMQADRSEKIRNYVAQQFQEQAQEVPTSSQMPPKATQEGAVEHSIAKAIPVTKTPPPTAVPIPTTWTLSPPPKRDGLS